MIKSPPMNLGLAAQEVENKAHLLHDWVKPLHVCYIPGPSTPLTEQAASKLLRAFDNGSHIIQKQPDSKTNLLLTSAVFDQPLNWRKSLLFNARRRFKLEKFPHICTLVQITPEEFKANIHRLSLALEDPESNPEKFRYPGLPLRAKHTLYEQGKRGGPILSLERVIQAQTMCLRVILLVGDDVPEEAYLFDLVGAHPRINGSPEKEFFGEIVQRLSTALSSGEVTEYKPVEPQLSHEDWQKLSTPAFMKNAGLELDKRGFFTEMVVIDNLVDVPALNDAIAQQYSEGCYSTWDPDLGALISTITGSARPVSKGEISENELAVIVGVQSNGQGVLTRPVEGLMNSPPSSEAFEMMDMDEALPKILLEGLGKAEGNGKPASAPVVRSKLHGHRGVSAFDPARVAYAPLEEAYFYFPVSCGSAAQARAIKEAFSRCPALTQPGDPRKIAFTLLPGHGLFIVEKWDVSKEPFQLIWEAMDSGALEITSAVPQGSISYHLRGSGLNVLRA